MTRRLGINLFAKKSKSAGGTDQLFTVRAGALQLADLDQRRDEPERTHREGSFVLAPHTVISRLRAIAVHERTVAQLVGDREDRLSNALVLGGKKSHEGQQQERRVQLVRPVELSKTTLIADTLLADIRVNLLSGGPPGVRSITLTSQRSQSGATIGGHPAHHLGERKVLRLAA